MSSKTSLCPESIFLEIDIAFGVLTYTHQKISTCGEKNMGQLGSLL
jgi:hypothetical protein